MRTSMDCTPIGRFKTVPNPTIVLLVEVRILVSEVAWVAFSTHAESSVVHHTANCISPVLL